MQPPAFSLTQNRNGVKTTNKNTEKNNKDTDKNDKNDRNNKDANNGKNNYSSRKTTEPTRGSGQESPFPGVKKVFSSTWEDGLIFDPEKFLRKIEECSSRKSEERSSKNILRDDDVDLSSPVDQFVKNKNLNKNGNINQNQNGNQNEQKTLPLSTSLSTSISTIFSTSSTSSNSLLSSNFSVSELNIFNDINIENIILKSLEGRCIEAFLRCKIFLKSFYCLTDERCQAYSPDEKVS